MQRATARLAILMVALTVGLLRLSYVSATSATRCPIARAHAHVLDGVELPRRGDQGAMHDVSASQAIASSACHAPVLAPQLEAPAVSTPRPAPPLEVAALLVSQFSPAPPEPPPRSV